MRSNRKTRVWPANWVDLYQGDVVLFVYARWWHARVAPGWLTFAEWMKPSFHRGVIREDDIGRAALVTYEPIETSPHVDLIEPVADEDVLNRIAHVRFGRVPGWNAGNCAIIDSMSCAKRAVACNYDDANGIDPEWSRYDAPLCEPYWRARHRAEMAELRAKYG